MKIKLLVYLMAPILGILFSGNLYADYSFTVLPNPTVLNGPAGTSGKIDFECAFENTGSQTESIWRSAAYDGHPFVSLSFPSFVSWNIDPKTTLQTGFGNSYISGNTYDLIIDWSIVPGTLLGSNGVIDFGLGARITGGDFVSSSDYQWVDTTVPVNVVVASEPSQLLSGLVVLLFLIIPICYLPRFKESV